LSADGNFHQQLRLGVKDQGEDPSYFGDAGFFVPTKLYQDFLQVAGSLKSDDKVCSQTSLNFNSEFSFYRKMPVQCKQETLQERDLPQSSKSMESLRINVSMGFTGLMGLQTSQKENGAYHNRFRLLNHG
jgi:hypothetical protein